jgi:hypothetical protein
MREARQAEVVETVAVSFQRPGGYARVHVAWEGALDRRRREGGVQPSPRHGCSVWEEVRWGEGEREVWQRERWRG